MWKLIDLHKKKWKKMKLLYIRRGVFFFVCWNGKHHSCRGFRCSAHLNVVLCGDDIVVFWGWSFLVIWQCCNFVRCIVFFYFINSVNVTFIAGGRKWTQKEIWKVSFKDLWYRNYTVACQLWYDFMIHPGGMWCNHIF